MYSLLHKMGYYAIPINSDGQPCVPFKDVQHSEDEIMSWDERYEATVGLVCGRNNVSMIDVDCNNAAISKSLLSAIRNRFKDQLIRYGSPNKFAVLIRTQDEGYTGKSAGYDSPDGIQVIEMKPPNGTMSIFGQHRKYEEVEYRWTRQFTPTIVPASRLPVWSLEDVQWLCFEFEKRANAMEDWTPKTRNTTRKAGTIVPVDMDYNDVIDESIEEYDGTPTRRWSLEELQELSNMYDPDDRDQWLKFGMVVKDFYVRTDGYTAAEGLRYWIEWSRESEKFDSDDDCTDKWAHFVVCKPGKGVTMESAKKEFTEYSSRPTPEEARKSMDLAEIVMRNFILVDKDDQSYVADMRVKASERLKPLRAAITKCKSMGIVDTDLTTGKPNVRQNPVNWWLARPNRKYCVGTIYKPCGDIMIKLPKPVDADVIEGEECDYLFNTYEGSGIIPLPSYEAVSHDQLERVMGHLRELFPTPEDMDRICTQIAHTIQRPWERPSNHILHINTTQGSGRGFLFSLISKLLGEHNTTSAKMNQLGSGWDDWRKDTLWCDIAEMDSHGKESSKYKLSDDLKSALTDTSALLNMKMGKQTTCEIFTRVMFSSNNNDPIKLTENDRRFWVVEGGVSYKPDEYYTKLYALLNDQVFLSHLYTYFLRYDYNKTMIFPNAQQCMTPAKLRLIKRLRTPEEKALYQMREVVGDLPVTERMVTDYVQGVIGRGIEDDMGLNRRHMAHLVQELLKDVVIRHKNGTMETVQQFNVSSDNTITTDNYKQLMAKATTKLKESL